jgi:hypothetical protein
MAGKPPAKIDIEQLEKVAQLMCTIEEAAAFFGCCKRTLLRYLDKPEYREAWERGANRGKMSLRRLQWKHANGTGSSAVQMTIHLSKHWLGESERTLASLHHTGTGPDGALVVTWLPPQ